MNFTEKVAKEISVLVPKLITGVRKSFFEIEDLTSRQIAVLLFIYETKKAKITDIAANFSLSLPTVTGIVDRLLKKGCITRIRDEQDRRLVYVRLNKRGEKFVNKFRNTVRSRWQKILACLSINEQKFYLTILKKLIKALDEEEF